MGLAEGEIKMTTVLKNVNITGVGIHSGTQVNVTVMPTDKNGIWFRRTDINPSDLIAASWNNVGEAKLRNTTIGKLNAEHVQTIEHLMAALFIVGIDSAIIDIDGPETPILDGSAAQFIDMFRQAGVTNGNLKKIVVKQPVIVNATEILKQLPWWVRVKLAIINKIAGRKSDGFVKLVPNGGQGLRINATLVYPEKIIGKQSCFYFYDGSEKSISDFIDNFARARTFGKFSEWEYLKKHGMGRGANENNVIALNDAGDGTLNKTIWPDEFVRHKIIDAVGDMFTSGGIICGDLISYKGSHAMNNEVLKKLFSDEKNYDIIDAE